MWPGVKGSVEGRYAGHPRSQVPMFEMYELLIGLVGCVALGAAIAWTMER